MKCVVILTVLVASASVWAETQKEANERMIEADEAQYKKLMAEEAQAQLFASPKAEEAQFLSPKLPYNCGGNNGKKCCCDPPARILRCMACAAGDDYAHHFWGQSQVNVAFRKWVTQSSYIWPHPASPKAATDGNRQNNAALAHCAITTNYHRYPYIYVHLGQETCVQSITLTGRANPQFQNQLSQFTLYVTSTYPQSWMKDFRLTFPRSEACNPRGHQGNIIKPTTFPCNKCGRYVLVHSHLYKVHLTLCEIEVKGRHAANNNCC